MRTYQPVTERPPAVGAVAAVVVVAAAAAVAGFVAAVGEPQGSRTPLSDSGRSVGCPEGRGNAKTYPWAGSAGSGDSAGCGASDSECGDLPGARGKAAEWRTVYPYGEWECGEF